MEKNGGDNYLILYPGERKSSNAQREKDARDAWELRENGISVQQIADLFECSTGRIYNLLREAFSTVQLEPAAHFVEYSLAQLDHVIAAMVRVLNYNHIKFTSRGEPIKLIDEEKNEWDYVPDFEPIFKAANTLMAAQDKRAKLLGLNAPDRAEITTNKTEEIDLDEIEALDLVQKAKNKATNELNDILSEEED